MCLEVWFDDIIPTLWPTGTTYIRKHAACTVRNIQAGLAYKYILVTAQWLNKEPHFIAEFPGGPNKICMFAIGGNIEKQLCCTVGPVIINQGLHFGDCCKKYHTVEWQKEMKPMLSLSWKNRRFLCILAFVQYLKQWRSQPRNLGGQNVWF